MGGENVLARIWIDETGQKRWAVGGIFSLGDTFPNFCIPQPKSHRHNQPQTKLSALKKKRKRAK